MVGMTWPDGTPVTPWADPWHDIAADIRAAMRSAFNGSPYAKPAPQEGDDDD